MSGEATHDAGANGIQRAKTWLEATGRAQVRWWVPRDDAKLSCAWADPQSQPFSFDMGGLLEGGLYEGDLFQAEIKRNLKGVGKQPGQYREYLAKCYRALEVKPDMCDHFMWITWHPFSQTRWTKLCTASMVRECTRQYARKALGSKDASPDTDQCKKVAERLWVIVLCERQETLLLSPAQLARLAAGRLDPARVS